MISHIAAAAAAEDNGDHARVISLTCSSSTYMPDSVEFGGRVKKR